MQSGDQERVIRKSKWEQPGSLSETKNEIRDLGRGEVSALEDMKNDKQLGEK